MKRLDMLSLQQLFTPEGQKFYKLFNEVAENLKQVSQEFYDAIHNTNGRFKEYLENLNGLEIKNDHVAQRLFVALGKNFITPFDREDIYALTAGLDDISDLSYGVVRQLKSYSLSDLGNASLFVAGEYKRFIALLAQTINEFKNKRALNNLAQHCIDMKKIIANCDARIDAAITSLFPTQSDPIEIIKWMEHYEMMQALIGKWENVVNVIESIIIKYG
jgi:uncharacterized protein Yka (UPF0111/DUF47 family)